MAKLTEAQVADARRLRDQIGKCRAWITGYEAGSGKIVLEADSLRQVQLLLSALTEGKDE